MKRRPALPWCVIVLLTGGCAATPFEYREVGEIRPGPGLFSGSDGVFTLSSESPGKASGAQAPADAGAVHPEYREFLDFQEFRRWKQANRNTPAWREFQAWREWKAVRSGHDRPR